MAASPQLYHRHHALKATVERDVAWNDTEFVSNAAP
jgi:hypothetical protein